MLHCPFCGAAETDRFSLEGRRFLVFACMFSPEVDPSLSEEEVARLFAEQFAPQGSGYFRATCDRLHLYVTKGEGGQALIRPAERRPSPGPR